MRPWVTELAKHGIGATALNLPKSNNERAIDVFRTRSTTHPGAAIGGHSYGGRMASLLAARKPVTRPRAAQLSAAPPGTSGRAAHGALAANRMSRAASLGRSRPVRQHGSAAPRGESLHDAELVIYPGQRPRLALRSRRGRSANRGVPRPAAPNTARRERPGGPRRGPRRARRSPRASCRDIPTRAPSTARRIAP